MLSRGSFINGMVVDMFSRCNFPFVFLQIYGSYSYLVFKWRFLLSNRMHQQRLIYFQIVAEPTYKESSGFSIKSFLCIFFFLSHVFDSIFQ